MSVRNTFPQQRPTLNLDFANSKTLDPRITFTRTSTATYVDEDGLIKSVDADVARFDHDPVTGECLGLLVEEQRSNLLTYSDQLDEQSNWVDSGTSWSANTIISPDGTQNADDPGFVSEKWGFYDVTNASWISEYPQNYPFTVTSEWVRHSATITTPSECTTLRFYPLRSGNDISYIFQNVGVSTSTTYTASAYYKLADDGTTVIAWGAQLEAGAFPTSYIPRPDASTATRNPDSVTMTGDNFSDWYNQEQGSIVWIGRVYTKEDPGLCAFRINRTDGASLRGMAMQIDTRYSNNNNTINFMSRTQSSNIPSKVASVGIVTSTSTIKLAGGYIESVGLSTIRAAFNGDPENSYSGSSQTDVVDGAMNELEIMGDRGTSGANYPFTGVCEQLVYYPRILTDAQLQNLTK